MENTQNSQQLAYQFQHLREQKGMYEQNLDIIQASLNNLINTRKTIENLHEVEDGEEILLPVGGMINLRANIVNPDKVLLSVSDDIVIEKNLDRSKEFIEKLIEQHRDQIEFLNEQIDKIEANLQGISQVFRQGLSQSQLRQQPPQS
ncbi:MAG: Prefoldin subunit alpha [Promethearchaeota archaeon]|jgi:prefoldin alpha subunit|nr:MAG: Prefoldin subunit alpha [Candidatus Lokiarchaeota archaeon]